MKIWIAIGALITTAFAGVAKASFLESPNAITLVGSIPHPIDLAYDSRANSLWSWGGALGSFTIPLPSNSSAGQIAVGIGNIEGRGRWHPFEGAFFLGAILGIQNISGTAKETILVGGSTNVPTTITMKIQGGYLTPHLGWIWVIGPHFTWGLEFGYQIPISASSNLTPTIDDPTLQAFLGALQTTQKYKDLQDKINLYGDAIGRIQFPYTALRLGWAF